MSVKLDARALGLDDAKAYNVFECFSEEKHQVSAANGWQFDTSVEPIGVRVYLVTILDSLDKAIPPELKLNIPRAQGALVDGGETRVGPRQVAYRTSDILNERRGRLRSDTLEAYDSEPRAPIALEGDFSAVDLKGLVNAPLDELIGTGTPLMGGMVKLGEIPALVAMDGDEGYVKCAYAVKGLRIGQRVDTIHFFDGGNYDEHTGVVGKFVIHYMDGAAETLPLVNGITTGDFKSLGRQFSRTQLIWKGFNEQKDYRYLYRYDWTNPHPEKTIQSIDAYGRVSIWAITLEKSH